MNITTVEENGLTLFGGTKKLYEFQTDMMAIYHYFCRIRMENVFAKKTKKTKTKTKNVLKLTFGSTEHTKA